MVGFVPNEAVATAPDFVPAMKSTWADYLSQGDWHSLQQLIRDRYEPSVAGTLIVRAHELADTDKLRYALIEGVTALEVAIEEFFRARTLGNESIEASLQSYWDLPLPTRITAAVLAAWLPQNLDDLRRTLEAINIRNKLVHEGVELPQGTEEALNGLLRTASTLLAGPQLRFPMANTGNEVRKSAEDWGTK